MWDRRVGARTAAIGPDAWLDEQFGRPIGLHQPERDERMRMGQEIGPEHRRWAWWRQVVGGPDPERQRVAFALSEIFVVSDNQDAVGSNPQGPANYDDMLLRNAFGNYRDLLRDVSLYPIMGAYLGHLRNEKSNPRPGRADARLPPLAPFGPGEDFVPGHPADAASAAGSGLENGHLDGARARRSRREVSPRILAGCRSLPPRVRFGCRSAAGCRSCS